jgi:hypothetical protein
MIQARMMVRTRSRFRIYDAGLDYRVWQTAVAPKFLLISLSVFTATAVMLSSMLTYQNVLAVMGLCRPGHFPLWTNWREPVFFFSLLYRMVRSIYWRRFIGIQRFWCWQEQQRDICTRFSVLSKLARDVLAISPRSFEFISQISQSFSSVFLS